MRYIYFAPIPPDKCNYYVPKDIPIIKGGETVNSSTFPFPTIVKKGWQIGRRKWKEKEKLKNFALSLSKASSSTSTILGLYLLLFTDCPKVPDNQFNTEVTELCFPILLVIKILLPIVFKTIKIIIKLGPF